MVAPAFLGWISRRGFPAAFVGRAFGLVVAGTLATRVSGRALTETLPVCECGFALSGDLAARRRGVPLAGTFARGFPGARRLADVAGCR